MNSPAVSMRGNQGPRGRSLASQLTLVTILVAVVTAVVAGLVAYPLVANAAAAQARESLGRQADLVADAVQRQQAGEQAGVARLRQLLAAQGISLQVSTARKIASAPVTEADLYSVLAGEPLSDVRESAAGRIFLEGRAAGTAVVWLSEPASVASSQSGLALRRLMFALLIGVLTAVVLGSIAARRVARPLRRAALAADRLAAGARDVRVEPEGPAEVASVAESLNLLTAALSVSEARQRDFLLSVSHELRTPLTGISGYAEALADGVVSPEDVAATGQILVVEAARLERLVKDLLDLARLGAADFHLDVMPVDLTSVVQQAAAVWADRCSREGLVFSLEVPDVPIVVSTDPMRVRQILDNLAENALRVTPSGHPLVICLRTVAGGAVLEVRDGGPGLTPQDVPVAFAPAVLFDRYRGVRQVGSGVGLALVGRLASRLGGRADAGSAPEGGARFSVMLPIAGPAL